MNPNYITIQQYAEKHNISVKDLVQDIIKGKYETAICIIGEDEECKTLSNIIRKPIGFAQKSEDYVTAKEYAALKGIQYAGLLRSLKRGLYKTAIKEHDNKWYIKRTDDGGKNPLQNGFITAKDYAEQNGIRYQNLLSDIYKGYYKTAYQDLGRHWFIKPDDKRDDTTKPDPELEEYISMKEFAKRHCVNYQNLSEDVRNGVYDPYIKRKGDRFVYILRSAPCKSFSSKNVMMRGFLTTKEYAEKNGVNIEKVRNDVVNGKYNTATKISNVWYIKATEPCKTQIIPKNYIIVMEYAKKNNISYRTLLAGIRAGKYKSPKKIGRHWYIDKNEPCKSANIKK